MKRKTMALAALALAALPLPLIAGDISPTAPVSPASPSIWALKLPQDDRLLRRGLPETGGSPGGTNSMAYPAPNALGFIAGVFTHALIVDKMKQDEKERQQSLADRVWQPYEPAIDGLGVREVVRRAIPKTAVRDRLVILDENQAAQGRPGVSSMPVYAMTPDQRALVLDNTISLQPVGGESSGDQQIVLRVISSPKDAENPVVFWTDNNGERLKDEMATLLAMSLDIVLGGTAGGLSEPEGPYRTIRYLEGGTEKIERAQTLFRRCDRLLLRTLRGTLMSVPRIQTGTEEPQCRT